MRLLPLLLLTLSAFGASAVNGVASATVVNGVTASAVNGVTITVSWTPPSLGSKLWAWLDASQESLSGAAVSTFTDRSGNGRDFTQTLTKRPTGNTSPNRLTFDGTDDSMTMASTAVPRRMAIIVALDPVATASNGMLMEGAVNDPWYCYGQKDNTYSIGGTTVNAASASWMGTAPTVVVYYATDSNMFVRKDRVSVVSGAASVSGTSTQVLALCARGGTSIYWAGDIYEIILGNDLTAGEVQSAELYLQAKWGTP